jgi:hypothetical protein
MKPARLAIMVWRCAIEARASDKRLVYGASHHARGARFQRISSSLAAASALSNRQSRYASFAADEPAAWPSMITKGNH